MKRCFISGYDYVQDVIFEPGTYTFWAYIKSEFGNTLTFALANEANEWEVFDVDVQQGQWTKAYVVFTIKEKKVKLNLIYRYFDIEHPVYVLKPQIIKGNIPSDAGASPFDIDQITDDLHDSITSIEDFTNEEFADRMLSSGERVSLRRDLEAVEIIFQSLKGSYDKLLVNPFINETALTDLTDKYNAVSAAKDDLFLVINTIIDGDNIVSSDEIAAKDAALLALNNALYAYNMAEKELQKVLGEDYTQKIGAIRDFTDEEFADRMLSETEKVSLRHDLDNIQMLLDEITASYNETILNPFLSTENINLLTAKYNALLAAWQADGDPLLPDGLKTVIQDIINGDDIVTQEEINIKNAALNNFNDKLGEYSAAEVQMSKFTVDFVSQQAEDALAAAATAQDTADGKIYAFYLPDAPTTAHEGDIWFDTNDGNKIYTYRSEGWVSVQDGGIAQAINWAQTAMTTADGKAIVYYQAITPTGQTAADKGDMWVNTGAHNRLYIYDGTAWVVAQDYYLALITAQDAQTTAEGYMRARYVRDWIKGSSVDNNNRWNEIKVIHKSGINIAQGRTPTSNGIFNASYPAANITDTNLTTYAQIDGTTPATANYVQIDLGQIYNDIDYIQVWHYYADGRIYYGTKTEISINGIDWTTIFDSSKSEVYKETIFGNTLSLRMKDVLPKVLRNSAIADRFSGFDGGLATAVIMEMREPSTTTRGDATAGISGIQGVSKDLPAFWAGGTYEDALNGLATAIIKHNGKAKFTDGEFSGVVYATDGTFTGEINALSGTIGGFTIANKRLGVEGNADGMALTEYYPDSNPSNPLESMIKFQNADTWAGVGTNVLAPSTGLRALGRFNNYEKIGHYEQKSRIDVYYTEADWINAGSPQPAQFFYDEYDELRYIEVTVYYQEWVTEPFSKGYGITIDVDGADENIGIDVIRGKIKSRYGGVISWDNEYMGAAYTDTLEMYIKRTNQFIFTSISSDPLTVRLPSLSYIEDPSDSKRISFLLTIVVHYSTLNKIRLTSVTNGQLRDNDGGAMSYIDMVKGDTIMLRYYNGNYYIMSRMS